MRFSLLSRALSYIALAPLVGGSVIGGVPATVSRGTGDLEDGKLDLLVYFTYPEADPAGWQPVFEEYSKLLLNATEGGVQLGSVQFTSCAALADDADVWVLNDNSGARAHIGGLGRDGQHITISQTHRSYSGFALGQFGLAHETGHYVWSLYDEYLGLIDGLPGVSSQHFCATPSGTSACLMDGGTTVFPNNQRTEFCTEGGPGFFSTIHNAGVVDGLGRLVVNDQEYVHGASCWRQIQRSGAGGLSHPASEPLDIDLAHEPVEFDLERYAGSLAMALLIDTSGSMSGDGRLQGAVLGGELALGMMREGESHAVYSFDDRLRTLVAPQVVTSSRRDAAIAKVSALEAGGGTEAGEALLELASELEDVDGCRRFVILLTDGVSDDPDVNESEVIQELLRGDVLVFPVALGSFPDDAALLELADATGGQYFHAPRPEDVPGVFADIFSLAGGGTTLGSVQGPGGALGSVTLLDVDVPEGADALVVALSAEAASEPVLELRGPRGESILSSAPASGVERVQAGDVLLLRVAAPSAGAWRLGLETRAAVAPHVTLHAAVESRLLSITTALSTDRVGATEPVQLEVGVVQAHPVAGASVRGSVRRPDGVLVPVTLRDDGHPASGDREAGDGVYSTLFAAHGGSGIHRIDLEVRNVDGVAASNRECGLYGRAGDHTQAGSASRGEEGAEDLPISPFRALASRSFLVLDEVGDPRPGGAELIPHEAVNDSTGDTKLAFGLKVEPDEALHLERIELSVSSGAEALAGLELHLDSDQDGRIDRPRRPLARTRAEGQRLILERAEGPLALLPAGAEVGFLLVDPAAFRTQGASQPAGGFVVRRDLLRPFAGGWRLVLVPCAALLLLIVARRRGPVGPALTYPRARFACPGALLLVVALPALLPACGPSGSAGAGDDEVLVDPGRMSLVGASSGERIEVQGQVLVLDLES